MTRYRGKHQGGRRGRSESLKRDDQLRRREERQRRRLRVELDGVDVSDFVLDFEVDFEPRDEGEA